MYQHKGFGIGSNSYGQFWYGIGTNGQPFPGFLYKKNVGVGARRSSQFIPGGGSVTNKKSELWNTYIPGSGVGATSISVRRAKLLKSRSCNNVTQFP